MARLGQLVDEHLIPLLPTQPISCKDRPGTVAEQPLQSLAVCRFDSYLGVEGETTSVPPGLHLFCVIRREQSTPNEQTEYPLPDLLLGLLDNLTSLRSTRTASEKKLSRITSSYRSELQNERIETESQAFRLREELEKVGHRSDRLVLRAPQNGIVKDLATHTRGTVVSPGTVLVSLVPQDEPLQAEVLVRNEDVGFVHVDQRVKLKFAAYSFQKYGMINGTVVHVGADATDNGAQPPGQSGESPDMSTGYRYKALVRLDTQHLDTNGQRMHLTPGMLASAEIHLGHRTVMEYLLSPTQKAWQEAGRER